VEFTVLQVLNPEIPLPDWVPGRLAAAGARLLAIPQAERETIYREGADADLLWDYVAMGRITRRDLEALSRLGAIVKVGTGTDHIDVAAATELGIIVANTPGLAVDPVADHTVSLLFSLVRQVTRQDRLVRENQWKQRLALPLRRYAGATLGFVGFGRIAQAVARKVSGFDMQLIAYAPHPPAEAMAALRVRAVPLDELLSSADYVSIHCPLTPSTYHLIGERELRLMRPHAVLINTARGAVVDEPALIRALEEGRMAGAALDVLEHEPPAEDSPLRRMANVILTPHTAGHSDRFPEDFAEYCLDPILDLAQHRWPQSVVNREVRPRWGSLAPRR
jgi:D-3-phosphoglycerate dehydrogenase / 2-oxoglutarate reductase